jgi:hypothetical protein
MSKKENSSTLSFTTRHKSRAEVESMSSISQVGKSAGYEVVVITFSNRSGFGKLYITLDHSSGESVLDIVGLWKAPF